jgi:hypothetical protein
MLDSSPPNSYLAEDHPRTQASSRTLFVKMSTSENITIPKIQRSWRVVRQGNPSKALQYVHDAPVRTDLNDGEVLVKVGAAALNPV